MNNLSWIFALATLTLVLPALTYWALQPRRKATAPLPTDWALTSRPVFNTNERRAYRLLRETLPQHIVLSKLPLVRFCQPVNASETRYWYDLLGAAHVGFAICSANGRVLAAIDLELDRGSSRRLVEIKQSVLAACRVRYLRCPPDQLPSVDELHTLVPQLQQTGMAAAPAQAQAQAQHQTQQAAPVSPDLSEARESLVSTVASRRAQRTHLWHDAHAFQDSFFAPDSRFDSLSGLELPPLPSAIASSPSTRPEPHAMARKGRAAGPAGEDDEVAGIVVDRPVPSGPQLRGA